MKTKLVKPLSWKPIRVGKLYCSPACGRGCKYEEYEMALEAGKKLAATVGNGWKARIWENLGWHYSVIKNGSEIIPSSNSYWIDLRIAGIGQVIKLYKNPVSGLKQVIAKTRKNLAASEKYLSKLENI